MATFLLGLTGVNASHFKMGHGYSQEQGSAQTQFLCMAA